MRAPDQEEVNHPSLDDDHTDHYTATEQGHSTEPAAPPYAQSPASDNLWSGPTGEQQIDEYRKKLLRIAYARRSLDPDDLVQTVLVEVLEEAEKKGIIPQEKVGVLRVRSRGVDGFRKNRRRSRDVSIDNLPEESQYHLGIAGNCACEFERDSDELLLLKSAWHEAKLSEVEREVIRQTFGLERDEEADSDAEIAANLGLEPGYVRVIRSRAIKKLRKYFGR